LNVIACRKPKKEQDTETMLSGSVMAILSMLVHQISEIRQKPTLLGSDPQNMSSCSTLDKIAIIEGTLVLPSYLGATKETEARIKELLTVQR
jgi:hypothetical protein